MFQDNDVTQVQELVENLSKNGNIWIVKTKYTSKELKPLYLFSSDSSLCVIIYPIWYDDIITEYNYVLDIKTSECVVFNDEFVEVEFTIFESLKDIEIYLMSKEHIFLKYNE